MIICVCRKGRVTHLQTRIGLWVTPACPISHATYVQLSPAPFLLFTYEKIHTKMIYGMGSKYMYKYNFKEKRATKKSTRSYTGQAISAF